MAKPVIAVDIDEVLGEYAVDFVKFSNERWGTSLEVSDYTEHWSQLWQIEHEETIRRRDTINESDLVANLSQIPGANEALTQLSESFDIVLVTSRPLILEQDTRAWLEKCYANLVKDIYFAGMYDGDITDKSFLKTKSSVYSQISPQFVIDDQFKHCQAAADLGINAILFGDYPWNHDVNESELITRCRDWNEVLTHINLHS